MTLSANINATTVSANVKPLESSAALDQFLDASDERRGQIMFRYALSAADAAVNFTRIVRGTIVCTLRESGRDAKIACWRLEDQFNAMLESADAAGWTDRMVRNRIATPVRRVLKSARFASKIVQVRITSPKGSERFYAKVALATDASIAAKPRGKSGRVVITQTAAQPSEVASILQRCERLSAGEREIVLRGLLDQIAAKDAPALPASVDTRAAKRATRKTAATRAAK